MGGGLCDANVASQNIYFSGGVVVVRRGHKIVDLVVTVYVAHTVGIKSELREGYVVGKGFKNGAIKT